jgi:hypothetical protein
MSAVNFTDEAHIFPFAPLKGESASFLWRLSVSARRGFSYDVVDARDPRGKGRRESPVRKPEELVMAPGQEGDLEIEHTPIEIVNSPLSNVCSLFSEKADPFRLTEMYHIRRRAEISLEARTHVYVLDWNPLASEHL